MRNDMNTLNKLPQEIIHYQLSQVVASDIENQLNNSLPGHCLRISTLPESIMYQLCASFNENGTNADVVLLIAPGQNCENFWQVTASRLVELRNNQEKPLLVFIPPGIKTAAEDSFDISTFVEMDLGDVPNRLRQLLGAKLPDEIRVYTDRVVEYLDRVERVISPDDVVRYYLAILNNELKIESAGGAIYQLGLIPDFDLFFNPDRIEQRLERNLGVLQTLIQSNQPLLARIHSLKLQPTTIQSALYHFLRNVTLDSVNEWGEIIATDMFHRKLAFEQWPFVGESVDRDKILIYLDDINLTPKNTEETVGPDNPLYLHVNRHRSIRLKWETNPKPAAVNDLKYFRIEIVSTDGAVAWESKNIPNSQARAAYRSKLLNVSEFRDHIEDGLYFFRVRAYTESGDILSEEDAENHPEILRDYHNPNGKRFYESEDIWFWVDETTPPPAEPQRNIIVNSFLEAKLYTQFAALDRDEDPFSDNLKPRSDRTGWINTKKKTEATYNIVYDAQARYTIPVSSILRQIELDTLLDPSNLGRLRLNFSEGLGHDGVKPVVRSYYDKTEIPEDFLQTRAHLFSAILGTEENISATVDLLDFKDMIIEYAESYQHWLNNARSDFDRMIVKENNGRQRTLPIYLDIDIVEVLLASNSNIPHRVYLLAPTHPLRLLWHYQRAAMAQSWIKTASDSGKPKDLLSNSIRQYMRTGLLPINLPPMLRPTHTNYPEGLTHFYIEQGPLNLFWSLYVREDTSDSRTIRSRTQRVLGINRQSATINQAGIDKKLLIQKFNRYLVQHPYVRVFKINIFNPGDAGLIADAILGIEKNRKKLPSLRYELRLFTESSDPDDVGEAIIELMNPEQQVSTEADAFAVPSQNHLFPKMRFSRNRVEDFLLEPEKFEAHITLLHDLFPIEVEIEKQNFGRSSYAYGLIQEQVTRFAGDARLYSWQRQLLPKECQELPTDDNVTSKRIASLLESISMLQAFAAVGKKAEGITPSLQLTLCLEHKNLLYQVHVVSDWVFIIDRHLGLEYFDSELSIDRMAYLLDFTPEFGGTDTDRLMLTTRSVDEVSYLVTPALDNLTLKPREDAPEFFLQLLRSLSGRVALKLLSSPSQVQEALGLALARLFLEQYGLLEDCILIPLDAHNSLFNGMESEVQLEDEVTLQRSDLLLVTYDDEERTLYFHIVEVKLRKALGDLGAYISLRQQIESQINNSENALRLHFDPHVFAVDRIDRQIKIKELISLLSFYLARSQRYGLISPQAARNFLEFIESLDQGYALSCSGSGLIFDFSFQGLDQDAEHAGLTFHRVGANYSHLILENGLRRKDLLLDQMKEEATTIEEVEQKRDTRERIITDTSMRRDKTYHSVQSLFRPIKSIHGDFVDKSPKGPSDIEVSAPEEEQGYLEQEQFTERERIDLDRESHSLESGQITSKKLELTLESPESSFPIDEIPYNVLLGETGVSSQYGILGKVAAKVVALDLDGTNTISLFGVQGGGKSYTVGSILEMATQTFDGINKLPSPLASVVFHYHESQDYPPEFVSMVEPNSDETQVRNLQLGFNSNPAALQDVLILTSADKLEQRRLEFPNVQVEPIFFSSNELSFKDWRFLMGVVGNQMYMKQINMIMRQLRGQLTIDHLKAQIDASPLTEAQKQIASIRLNFAAQFINDNSRLADVLHPGRMIIVDLRDEFIDKDEALGLFVVMLNIFANAGKEEGFNKLIVFDEAHKYMDNLDLTGHIVEVIRQMRHQGVSVIIASQDPPSLPNAIIELSSLVILHRFNSPQWLKHVQRSVTALSDLTPAQMAALRPGEAYVWATKATETLFTQKAVKMYIRPRVTQHGGGTKKAV